MKKLIVNLAPTGMIPTKDMTPHVPVSAEEIVSDALQCASLGASMVHIHARDDKGIPTYQPEIFRNIITAIRRENKEIILAVTTSGRTYNEYEKRSAVLDLTGDARPDMASLTLSSVNFNKVASINSPDMIVALAAKMREKGIIPELEVFDLGMINFAHYLIRKGLIAPPYYFNILLGNIAAAQAKLLHLGLLVSELPPDSIWSVTGIGDSQCRMNMIGIIAGDGVRVGLEDNIWFDEERTKLATNAMLVERIATMARVLGREIATPAEVRGMLKL
jgi:3-keto-5-aminohexanoate cleavage enzyme